MLALCLEGISNVVRPRVRKNLQDRVARLGLGCSAVKAQWGKEVISTQVCKCAVEEVRRLRYRAQALRPRRYPGLPWD